MPQVGQAIVATFQAIAAFAGPLGTGGTTAAAGTAAAAAAIATGVRIATQALLTSVLTPTLGATAPGGQVTLKLDLDSGVPLVFGRTAVGGKVIYRQGFSGVNNQHLGIIGIISAGPIEAFEDALINNVSIGFQPESPGPPAATSYFNPNFMYLWRKLGTPTDTAHLVPTPPWSEQLPGRTSSHTLPGHASFLWDLYFDTARYSATGVPKFMQIVKGLLCYDPRLDSTYPGGSGSHRLADPTTWEWSENPWICALAYITGSYVGGVKAWGVGIPEAGIDWAAFVDAANVADANGWTCGGEITTADDKWQGLSALCQAGGGRPLARSGLISCYVSAPKTAVYSLTAADLCGPVRVRSTNSRRDRKNRIVPKYRSPDHYWEIVAAEAVTDSAYVTEDGGEQRTREATFPFVQDVDQAAQLAGYDLADSREGQTLELPCKPRLLNVRVGEAITVTLAEAGLSAQKCVVLARSLDYLTAQVTLTVRIETDAKHTWALGLTGTAPTAPSLPIVDPNYVVPPGGSDFSLVTG